MPLLSAENITKRFPGVLALDGVRLQVEPGEVHALLGENGAGKSTLLKILSGAQHPGSGQIVFAGKPLSLRDSPMGRQSAGIVTIYQEFNLLPAMSIAENMFLGREPLRFGLIDWARLFSQAADILNSLGVSLDPRLEVRTLNVADQQMVEIAKAMTLKAQLIIMDEPTAALSDREVAKLHTLIRDLSHRGIAIIYVTHKLKEVKAVCNRFTVMRDGRFVADGDVAVTEIPDMIRLMVGRDVGFNKRPGTAKRGHKVLETKGISRRRGDNEARGTTLKAISLDVRAGEIVGLAGLVGAGRTEFARLIFAADRMDDGILMLEDRRISLASPREALAAGVALVPEDRKQQGCFLDHSIRHNLTLPSLKRLSFLNFFVNEKAEADLVETYRQKLSIKMSGDTVAIGTLSGGNQQKVLLARCMALRPKVLIVDEPTRGIDIGAKAEVHQVLSDLVADGVAVIVISSELPEIMAVSDRIVVFREGHISGVVAGDDATEETLMRLMATGEMTAAA